jgi:uncharacterized membrane protein YqiK
MHILKTLVGFWWVLPILLACVFWPVVARAFGVILVPQDRIGIVTKKFRLIGEDIRLPDGALVALKGEAGIQADTLAPGLHLWYWPWQYAIELAGFITVPEGKVGVIEAADGAQIDTGRVFARKMDCDSFQNARAFLTNGGQRGPQIEIIRPGTYRINTALFTIRIVTALTIPENRVGLVTTNDGAPLPTGDIAGPEVAGHHSFQDAQKFVENGGYKGRQEQVILAGTYYHNPMFVTVELVDLIAVPIGYVGVVNAFVGKSPSDAPSDIHANIVKRGEKGVWDKALDPGKYPINIYTHKVEMVPTTNIVLNWAGSKSESHQLDKNLSTITVRSADGFSFNLDVSQIIHIAPDDASKVIARFGSMQNLVTQVLEPLIGNYFRNSAQAADIIAFLSGRAEEQAKAKECINAAISSYAVQAVDTLIGDIVPPEELMKTLTDRKVAQQRVETLKQQKLAETARGDLEEASANADTKARVVDAQRAVEIAELDASAKVKKADGDAKSKTINATADASVLTMVGEAEATKALAVGTAEATVLKAKVDAVGKEAYASMAIITDLAKNKIPLVPQIMAGGGQGGGTLVEALVGNLLADRLPPPGGLTEVERMQKLAGISPPVIKS